MAQTRARETSSGKGQAVYDLQRFYFWKSVTIGDGPEEEPGKLLGTIPSSFVKTILKFFFFSWVLVIQVRRRCILPLVKFLFHNTFNPRK